jgi:hypothetical protein
VEAAIDALERAEQLSPYDPLLFAMKCSRAISLGTRGQYEEAVPWAIRATQEPNVHFHIYAIAASLLELVGRSDDARDNAGWVLNKAPDYSVSVFQRSFPHSDEAARKPLLQAMERAGLPRS